MNIQFIRYANEINDVSASVVLNKNGTGGGAVGEVVLDLISYRSKTISSTVDPLDDSNWVDLRATGGQSILIKGATKIIAVLKVMGVASGPTALEGVVKVFLDGEYADVRNSRFKVSVASGYRLSGLHI